MAKAFLCDIASIPEAIGYVKGHLEEENHAREAISKTLLRLEEVIRAIIGKAAGPDERYLIYFARKYGFMGKTSVVVKCRGTIVTLDDVIPEFEFDGLAPEVVEILNKRMKPLTSQGIVLHHRLGINTAAVEVGAGRVSRVVLNLMTLVSGLLIGILLRVLLPEAAVSFVAAEIFGSITTIFFNLLKMIIAPLVFFSIVTSFSGFTDIGELGKIGARTVALFVFFSVLGLLTAYGVFSLMPSGSPELQRMLDVSAPAVTAAESTSSLAWQNTKAFLLSIFPPNLLGAFVENNVLGVIFIAVLSGIAISRLQPEKAAAINRALDICNEFITKLTAVITGLMPVLIFCCIGKLVMTVDMSLFGTLAMYLVTIVIGFALMVLFYMLAMFVCGIDPFAFLKGFSPALFTAFTLASSTATVPTSLDCCVNRLKLPRAITYFVIPLGATINMSGSCIMLMISCLYLAHVFCIEVTFSMVLPVMFMLLLLSMAAPGVPGSMVIMLATALPLLGVPAEATGLVVCFSALVGMLMVPVNSMGDAVTAVIVSKGRSGKE